MAAISVVSARPATEVERGSLLKAILHVEEVALPATWRDPDSETYLRAKLHDESAITLVISKGGSVIGYLLAIPLASVLPDLAPFDSDICLEGDSYYVDAFSVIPHGGFGVVRGVMRSLESEMKERGITKLCMHARVSNGLSGLLIRYFGDAITCLRRIDRWAWYNGEESTDFLRLVIQK